MRQFLRRTFRGPGKLFYWSTVRPGQAGPILTFKFATIPLWISWQRTDTTFGQLIFTVMDVRIRPTEILLTRSQPQKTLVRPLITSPNYERLIGSRFLVGPGELKQRDFTQSDTPRW